NDTKYLSHLKKVYYKRYFKLLERYARAALQLLSDTNPVSRIGKRTSRREKRILQSGKVQLTFILLSF
ncbi:hypothetical protein NPI25_001635, partial [Providencia stuartii]